MRTKQSHMKGIWLWLIMAILDCRTVAPSTPLITNISSNIKTKTSPHKTTTTFTRQLFTGLRRHLQDDTGFDRFNELFADATLALGDQSIDVVGNAVTLDINDLECSGIVIGEIITGHEILDGNVLEFTVQIAPFNFTCVADYRYRVLFLPGDGSMTATAIGNSLTTKIHLKSPSTFELEPPTTSVIHDCQAEIKTDGRVQFNGDWAADLANTFKGSVSDLIDNLAKDAVCREFSVFGPEFFSDLLVDLKARFDDWLLPLPDELADPLFPERNFTVPNGVELLNFRPADTRNDTVESIADLFVGLLKENDKLFGESEVDPVTGEADLGINNFLRSSLLDERGAFQVDALELQPDFDPVIFEGHDRLTDTSIIVESIKVVGLDSLTAFEPFQDIGDYTLGNDLEWTTLSIEVNMTVDIKPSTLPNSMISSPRPIQIIENITISMNMSDLDVALSVFMPVDRTKFDDIRLGSILETKNVLPCLMSAMARLEFSELNVTVDDFSVPTLTGFVSPGIDRTVSNIVKAAFDAYKPTLLRAMPGIFQTSVRETLNARFGKSIGQSDDSVECEAIAVPPSSNGRPVSVDFRDLFLDPDKAMALGGKGDQSYGSLGPLAYSLIQDRLTNFGSDGLPMINELVVRPFTERQSGKGGQIVFPETIFEVGANTTQATSSARSLAASLLNGTFSFSVGNIRLFNIDTISTPLDILQVSSQPYVLENSLSIGGGRQNPLQLLLALTTGESETKDEIDISLSVDRMSLSADLKALLDANAFLNFPLGDLLEFNCWLASFKQVELDSSGFAVNPNAERGMSLENFETSLSGFSLQAACVRCNSPGATLLPELQQILQNAGAISTLGGRLPELFDAVVMSETFQTTLDRLTADSARFCPTSPEYDEDAVKKEYDMIPLPTLSDTSIDTILFSVIIAAQTGFVIFAENQRMKGVVDTDPLSYQRKFVAPEDVRLLDWTNIGNSSGLGGIADEVFSQVRQFLGGNETSFFDAEELMGKVLDSDGGIELNPDLSFSQGDVQFSLNRVRVVGLDSFAVLDIFEPVAPQTLVTTAQFANVDVTIDLSLDSPSTPEAPQTLSVNFNVKDVAANIGLFAAFDLDSVAKLELGSLMSTKTMFRCILSAALAFEITELDVSVGSFSTPTVNGLRDETGASASAALSATFTRYQTEITEAIPAIFNGVLRETLSAWVVPSENATCSRVTSGTAAFVDFRDLLLPPETARELGGSGLSPYGDILSAAYSYMKEELFASKSGNGLAELNEKVIRSFTESQSGVAGRLFFEGDIFNQGQSLEPGGIDATVRIRLYDFFVNNLDTIASPAVLLDPMFGKANELNNSIAMGVDRRLEIGIHLTLELTGSETDISNDVVIKVDFERLQVLLVALAKLSTDAFMAFPVGDIGRLQCWLATIPAPELNQQGISGQEPSLAVQKFVGAVKDAGLNITCTRCSGDKFKELSEALSSDEASDDVTKSANNLFEFMSEVISGKFLQVVVDRALNDAPYQCPHHPLYDPDYERIEFEPFDVEQPGSSAAFFVAIIVVGCVLLIAAGLVLLVLKLLVVKRHRKWVASLMPLQIKRLRDDQSQRDEAEKVLNSRTTSMFLSSTSIPLFWRVAMPFVILGNIGFFLSGHLSLGGSISILASIGGQTFREDSFFEFSMASSTIELWAAGAKELAILIFIFSFLWPYTKQLMTLGLWFAPPRLVSVSWRGSILLWLDFLAKWSMIDVFVLILTIVTFRISIQSPNLSFVPERFYSIDLLVVPKWGLYANMTAQIVSQLSSHVIIHYHRRIVDNSQQARSSEKPIQHTDTVQSDDDISNEPPLENTTSMPCTENNLEVLHQHAFQRPHRGEADKLVIRQFVNPTLMIFFISTAALVIVGCFVPSYSLDVLGLVGVLVESGQDFDEAKSEYSVLSTLGVLFSQAKLTGGAADYVGLGSMSILLIFSVLVVPVLQSVTLIVQWFAPLRPKLRRQLSVLLEMLQAWQYAEVYLLSLLVGTWQLGPVSEFMINPYCAPLERIFAELSYYGLLKEEDAQCLRTDVKVESTFYVLFVGTVSLAILNTFVMKAVAQFFRDQEVRSNFTAGETTVLDDLAELNDYEMNGSETSSENIRPVPVLFTDRFRWLLYRQDVMLLQKSSCGESKSVSEVQEHPVDSYESSPVGTFAKSTGSAELKSTGSAEEEYDIKSIDYI